jgi:hypothetical protein
MFLPPLLVHEASKTQECLKFTPNSHAVHQQNIKVFSHYKRKSKFVPVLK